MMLQDIASYAMDLEGASGALTGESEETARGQFQQMLLSSPSMRIAGGTDEVLAQHHRRARAGPARRYPRRQGRAVQQDPDQGAVTLVSRTRCNTKCAAEPGSIQLSPSKNLGPGSAAHALSRCAALLGHESEWIHGCPARQAFERIGVLEELLNERYSVRAFLPKPVPREIIDRVLATAQRTASWCNSQPWQVLIASGEAKERFRKEIYAAAMSGAEQGHDFTPPREYLGVYLDRRRESGFQLYNTLGIPKGDKMAYAKQALENYNFFGAPHVAVIHTDEPLGIYGAIDCGAYVGNFMLAAQALGLGTIRAGGTGAAFRADPPPLQSAG